MPCRRVRLLPVALLSAVAAAAAPGCGGDGASSTRGAQSKDVVAVIKGLDNPFFQTMEGGLRAAAQRHGLAVRVAAAAGLQDTTGQAATLESLVAERAGCYIINPIASTNLIRPLSHIPAQTPIINIDSPVDAAAATAAGRTVTTYIGTDNVAAGRLAADAMAQLVRSGDHIAVIAGIPGDDTSDSRARGFRDGARGRFSVVDTIAADFDRSRAALAAEDALRSDRAIRGLFAVNDEMALGVADAVRALGGRREVAVIGLDGIEEALVAVRRGAIAATVAQYPYAIGQLGVEACVAALRGKRLPARVDAPIQLVTRANVTRARARFPEPVAPFRDPLAALLGG
jgi:ABC-type sugar transport system substrate-binding protein